MSGLQLRFLAALPGGSTLAHRMRAIADAEAVEAAAVVSQGEPTPPSFEVGWRRRVSKRRKEEEA